jgi:uncharacterized membrane protein YkvA (DUF1232 family)
MTLTSLLKLARALPKYGRVVYCLYRDPRTPRVWKVVLTAALAAIWTPFINIPGDIPVLGQMEEVTLSLIAVRIAIARAPQNLVREHEEAIEAHRSIFHEDMERARQRADDIRDRLVG